MTDSEIVRKLKQLENYRQKISDIIYSIEESDHPKAAEIAEALHEQCWFPAWPEHVAIEYLDPQKWQLQRFGDNNTYGYIVSRRKVAR